jgi:S-adenosyl methyltransferase
VYVDNHPLVLVHATALPTSTSPGATHYVEADLHDPDTILREAAEILDFDRPVAIMLIAILTTSVTRRRPGRSYAGWCGTLAPGSHVALAHAVHSEVMDEGARQWNQVGRPTLNPRTPEEITSFFDGLELLEPGVVTTTRWRPAEEDHGVIHEVDQYAAVGRKS